jgi:hypothetical protein
MDASKITALRQKQNTVYRNRHQVVDSSTQIWRNQIHSSKYIRGVATCTGLQQNEVPILGCVGNKREQALMTGSTQRVPMPAATGSAVETYSSERILLQRAGRADCTECLLDAPVVDTLVYPTCFATSTNGPMPSSPDVPINNFSNPYLPPFDTYYKFKNPSALNPLPLQDKNLKHFVQVCDGCVMTPPSAPLHSAWPALILGADDASYSIGNGVSFDPTGTTTALSPQTGHTYTTGAFVGTMRFYNGGVTDPQAGALASPTGPIDYALSISDTTGNTQGYVAAYDTFGKLVWATAIYGRDNALLVEGYNVAQDQTGVYVVGYFSNSVEFFHATPLTGSPAVLQQATGTGQKILSTATPASLFLAKWTHDGRFVWATHIDNVNDILNSGALQILNFSSNQITTNGSQVFICNYYQGTTTVYGADGTMGIQMTSTSSTHQQGFLTGFNAATGAFAWATTFNSADTTASSVALGCVVDKNNVYVSGGFVKTVTYYNSRTTTGSFTAQGTLATQNPSAYSPAPNRSAFVAAYSASLGTFLWINQLDAFQWQAPCDAVRLAVDASGLYLMSVFSKGIYVYPNAGSTAGALTLTNLALPNSTNLGIVKYNTSTGSVIWVNKLLNLAAGSDTAQYYLGASMAADGVSLVLTGTMDVHSLTIYEANTNDPLTPLNIATTLQPINTSHPVTEPFPLTDIFVASFTANSGQLTWATIAGNAGTPAAAYGVSTNTSKTVIAAYGVGPINLYHAPSTLSVQPTQIAKTLAASNNYYAFTVAYDVRGQVL